MIIKLLRIMRFICDTIFHCKICTTSFSKSQMQFDSWEKLEDFNFDQATYWILFDETILHESLHHNLAPLPRYHSLASSSLSSVSPVFSSSSLCSSWDSWCCWSLGCLGDHSLEDSSLDHIPAPPALLLSSTSSWPQSPGRFPPTLSVPRCWLAEQSDLKNAPWWRPWTTDCQTMICDN